MERYKYIGIYSSKDRKYRPYGKRSHGSKAIPMIVKMNPSSIVDVGCGWNTFAEQIRIALPKVAIIGVDFACPGADIVADVTQSLPFTDKSFDLVTSFDVLEHIVPGDIERTLIEMQRVSRSFVFSICYRDSVYKWQGQSLHPTVRPPEWWIEQIYKAGAREVAIEKSYVTGQWK